MSKDTRLADAAAKCGVAYQTAYSAYMRKEFSARQTASGGKSSLYVDMREFRAYVKRLRQVLADRKDRGGNKAAQKRQSIDEYVAEKANPMWNSSGKPTLRSAAVDALVYLTAAVVSDKFKAGDAAKVAQTLRVALGE
jgi:hypothetical protein